MLLLEIQTSAHQTSQTEKDSAILAEPSRISGRKRALVAPGQSTLVAGQSTLVIATVTCRACQGLPVFARVQAAFFRREHFESLLLLMLNEQKNKEIDAEMPAAVLVLLLLVRNRTWPIFPQCGLHPRLRTDMQRAPRRQCVCASRHTPLSH